MVHVEYTYVCVRVYNILVGATCLRVGMLFQRTFAAFVCIAK